MGYSLLYVQALHLRVERRDVVALVDMDAGIQKTNTRRVIQHQPRLRGDVDVRQQQIRDRRFGQSSNDTGRRTIRRRDIANDDVLVQRRRRGDRFANCAINANEEESCGQLNPDRIPALSPRVGADGQSGSSRYPG